MGQKNYGWVLAWIMLFGAIVNYLDRSNLSYAAMMIEKEFNISSTELGILLSAFALPYGLSCLVMGYLVDRFGEKWIFLSAAILWSLATAFAGITDSFGEMYWARVLLGITEAPFFICVAVVMRKWFNDEERGVAISFVNTGPQIAGIVGPIILSALLLTIGWRHMFFLLGVSGIIIALLWIFLYKTPMFKTSTTHEIKELSTLSDYRKLLTKRSTWSMICGNFGTAIVQWTYITWLPVYFQKAHGISLMKTGFLSVIPFLAGFIGVLFGGFVSDYFIRKGIPAITARKYVIVPVTIIGALLVSPINFFENIPITIILLSLAYFCANTPNGILWALASDVAPKRLVGTLGSMQNFGAFIGGFIAPIAVGAIFQSTHSFTWVFIMGGIALLFSAFMYGIGLKSKIDI